MPAKDIFHDTVKIGLEKEAWIITDDPLYLDFGGVEIYYAGNRSMDKLNKYREIVKTLIKEYAQDNYRRNGVERELIFDTEHDHYQIVNVGWEKEHRVYGCVLHIDIKQGKIWLQYNGTEIEFAEELVKLGVPKRDIVIGFHSEFMRQFTEYAVS